MLPFPNLVLKKSQGVYRHASVVHVRYQATDSNTEKVRAFLTAEPFVSHSSLWDVLPVL